MSVNVGQGSSTKDYFLHRTMQSLERYFYLIVFNAFLHEQVMHRSEKPQNPQKNIWPGVKINIDMHRDPVPFSVRVYLQPVDVQPRVALPVAGRHGPIRTVGSGRPGHQRSARAGESCSTLLLLCNGCILYIKEGTFEPNNNFRMQWICWRVILCCFKHTLIYLNGINKNYLYHYK